VIAKLWAERRAGELLIVSRKSGERSDGRGVARRDSAVKLDDLGVSKHESSRWQGLARIPQREFEQAVDKAAKQGKVSAPAVRARLRGQSG
jgi:hypothetical protein